MPGPYDPRINDARRLLKRHFGGSRSRQGTNTSQNSALSPTPTKNVNAGSQGQQGGDERGAHGVSLQGVVWGLIAGRCRWGFNGWRHSVGHV